MALITHIENIIVCSAAGHRMFIYVDNSFTHDEADETADGNTFTDKDMLSFEDDDKDKLADKRGQIWGVLFCSSQAMF